MTRSENSCLEGATTYTPLGTFPPVDIKVHTVQFRPQERLTPEIRVRNDRKSLVFRQVAHKGPEWHPSLPMETAAEMMPLLTTRDGGTKSIAWRATGANRSATSERKTTLVNTSKVIAVRSLGCVGDARAGALGIRK